METNGRIVNNEQFLAGIYIILLTSVRCKKRMTKPISSVELLKFLFH